MAAKEKVASEKAPDATEKTFDLQRFLRPYSSDRNSECFRIASELGRDKNLLASLFSDYSALYEEQTSKDDRILLNSRLGVLFDVYRGMKEGVFLKHASLGEYVEGEFKLELKRLKKLHKAAPEYVPLPQKLIKDKEGKIVRYALKLIKGGKTLEEYLESNSALPEWVEDKIIDFTKKIHEKGLVHDDIYEGNFIIDEKKRRLTVIDPGTECYGTSLEEGQRAEKGHVYDFIQHIRERREELAAFPEGEDPEGKFTLNLESWAAYAKEKGIDTWEVDWVAYYKSHKEMEPDEQVKA